MTASAPHESARRGSTRKRSAPLLLLLAGALLFSLLPLFPALALTDGRTDALLGALPIARGETFSIRFTHSLNLSDVTDNIQWTGDALVCRSTLFTTYGAGIPDLSDGIGTDFSVTEDGFLLSGIDKAAESIPIMLETVPNHRLLWRGREYSLLARYGSGTIVTLSVRRMSLLARALHQLSWR